MLQICIYFKNRYKVLAEEGYKIPEGWNIRFEEETQEKTFTIRIPKAIDELTIEQLTKIVGGYNPGGRGHF